MIFKKDYWSKIMIFLLFLPLIMLVCFLSIAFLVDATMFRPYKKNKAAR